MGFGDELFSNLPDVANDYWWNTPVLEEKHHCAACHASLTSQQVYARVNLDSIYEVCSPECERDLPAIVADGLRQEEQWGDR